MTWWRRRLRDRLERAEQLVEDLRRQAWTLSHEVLKERAEKDLIRQAKEKAEHDAVYWRERAERFLDQVAFRQGMINMPTMTEAAPPAASGVDSVFSALGIDELPDRSTTPPVTAAPAAATVTGVDAREAQAAIDDVLQNIRAAS